MTTGLGLVLAALVAAPPPSEAEHHINSVAKTRQSTRAGNGDWVTGSAFLVSSSAEGLFFLTNAHVIVDASRQLDLFSERWLAYAKPVFVDRGVDLALVRITQFVHWGDPDIIDLGPADLVPFQFSTLAPRQGTPVSLVGYSYGDIHTDAALTRGWVLGRENGRIVVSARASPGNSGGPALDEDFKVLGVLVAGMVGGPIDRNFLIPLEVVAPFLALALASPSAAADAGTMVAGPPAIARECMVAYRNGVALSALGQIVDRDERSTLIVKTPGAGDLEFRTDAGAQRLSLAARTTDIDGIDGVVDSACRPSASSLVLAANAVQPLWFGRLPHKWSWPDELELSNKPPGLVYDALGRLIVDSISLENSHLLRTLPSLRRKRFALGGHGMGKLSLQPGCLFRAEFLAPGLEVHVETVIEAKGRAPVRKTIAVPADGGVFDVAFKGCERPGFEALFGLQLREPDLGPTTMQGFVTARAVGASWQELYKTGSSLASLRDLVRVPAATGRPHYSCRKETGWFLIQAPPARELRLSTAVGWREESGLLRAPGDTIAFRRDRAAEAAEVTTPHWVHCSGPTVLAQRSATSWLAQTEQSREPVLVKGRTMKPFKGLDVIAARATEQGYDVAVYTHTGATLHAIREDGRDVVVGTYSHVATPCVLDQRRILWCSEGPHALDGQKPVLEPSLAHCSPVLEKPKCRDWPQSPR